MSLKTIVAALGGDLYDGGRRANIPAPGHSGADRSVSLLLSGGRLVVHGFGAAGWREVLDDLRARGLVDQQGRLTDAWCVRDGGRRLGAAERTFAVQALWETASTVRAASPAGLYLARRGIARRGDGMAALRAHASAPLSVYHGRGRRLPALLAAVTAPDEAMCGVEIRYLRPNGHPALARLPRKTIGRAPAGSAVRLDAAGERLVVAEGVLTALSAGERFGLPAWALLGAGRLGLWSPPPGVRSVVIAGDRGRGREAAALRLARRLRALRIDVEVRLPPPPFGDWNDVARAEKKARAGGGARSGGMVLPVRGGDPDP